MAATLAARGGDGQSRLRRRRHLLAQPPRLLARSHDMVSRSVVALIDATNPNSASSAPNTHSVRSNAPAASSNAPRPSSFRIARVWPPLDFRQPRGAGDVLRAFGDLQRIECAAACPPFHRRVRRPWRDEPARRLFRRGRRP